MKLCPKCQKQFSDDANFCPVDAARLVPLEAQAAGSDSLTSRFELGARLGGSRTGAVHKATDKTTGKACVVKLVSPNVVALPGVAQRLERELKQLERVKSVGVAQVLASGKRQVAGQPGDQTWVATEWLEGAQTLAEAIGARGPIPADQAADLIEVVGEALIEAAQVGVVHRDLAPKNILFASTDSGSVKLINFSLPVPSTDKIPGVAEFVAPEQVEGRPVDQRSNLYSLGALYYYVLTGQTVFAGSPEEIHRQHQSGTIKPPSQLAQISAPVEAVIMRALDRSPTKRFLTVRQFVDEVTRVGHGEVIELKATMAMGKAGRPKGELVQTLLGVKGSFPSASSVPTAPVPAISPVQQVAQAAMPAPQPTVQAGPATVLSGPPQMPAPAPVPGAGMAAAIASPPTAMAPLTPPQGVDSRSPWAAPAQTPAAPVVAAPAPAPAPAPSAFAPPPAAPQAPMIAPQPAAAGKRKSGGDDGKGKFRETMWFKKGDLDAQAAIAAAEERARTGKDVATEKSDSKAIDERYNDDGSITRGDKEKYSLRTGGTQMMSAVQDPKRKNASQSLKVSEDELVGEMRGLPLWIKIAIPAGLLAVVLIIIWFARG
ncbi:MAG TPA: protein kinase [Kofleriaceae bacterium]|nr:protein kinase [Kofleriaceae bacterium]